MGKRYRGGQTVTADAPIDKIPLFVCDGAIVPFGPELQYAAEKAADPIELRVYPGTDGAFTLYEDEGDNTNYLRGRYATISITRDDKWKTLTLGPAIRLLRGDALGAHVPDRFGRGGTLHSRDHNLRRNGADHSRAGPAEISGSVTGKESPGGEEPMTTRKDRRARAAA